MGADTDLEVMQIQDARRCLARPGLTTWMAKALAIAIAMSVAVGSLHAQTLARMQRTPPSQVESASDRQEGLTVLFLGDSLSLCGFGKRLDGHLRQMPGVKAVFTYMACATQPLSWLKSKPYTNVQTRCGFWSIESVAGSPQPKEVEDVYGMRRGSTPKAHPVPKLEDLLAQIRPDILVMQTGGNLFDLFPGRTTLRPDRDAPLLKKYVAPFVSRAVNPPSPLKKIYWVASPTSGRASPAVQTFVVEQVRADFSPAVTVIDSRPLVSYPYHHMEPDHEHFVGPDMDQWADKVFANINQDLSSQSLASLKPLSELFPQITTASQTATPKAAPANGELAVHARLVFKSEPMNVQEFLPYQESMVGFVYEIKRVVAGAYDEKQILVMHPAYVGLRKQSLRKYRLGRTYKLRLRELESTPWNTVKRRDDSGRIDLQPYIQLQDEAKYPGSIRPN